MSKKILLEEEDISTLRDTISLRHESTLSHLDDLEGEEKAEAYELLKELERVGQILSSSKEDNERVALVTLEDDASGCTVQEFSTEGQVLEYLKELLLDSYKDCFDTKKEEEENAKQIRSADSFDELASRFNWFRWGENDIRLYHLVELE